MAKTPVHKQLWTSQVTLQVEERDSWGKCSMRLAGRLRQTVESGTETPEGDLENQAIPGWAPHCWAEEGAWSVRRHFSTLSCHLFLPFPQVLSLPAAWMVNNNFWKQYHGFGGNSSCQPACGTLCINSAQHSEGCIPGACLVPALVFFLNSKVSPKVPPHLFTLGAALSYLLLMIVLWQQLY